METTKTPAFYWIEKISHLLDSQFRLPGTKFKFGLDPVIGQIPLAGDAVTFLISAVLFLKMSKYGVSRKMIILMAFNICIDFIFGSIPFAGWIFDFYFKANDKNIRLLKEHYHEGKHKGNGTGIILLVVFIIAVLLALFVYRTHKSIIFLIHSLFQLIPTNCLSDRSLIIFIRLLSDHLFLRSDCL